MPTILPSSPSLGVLHLLPPTFQRSLFRDQANPFMFGHSYRPVQDNHHAGSGCTRMESTTPTKHIWLDSSAWLRKGTQLCQILRKSYKSNGRWLVNTSSCLRCAMCSGGNGIGHVPAEPVPVPSPPKGASTVAGEISDRVMRNSLRVLCLRSDRAIIRVGRWKSQERRESREENGDGHLVSYLTADRILCSIQAALLLAPGFQPGDDPSQNHFRIHADVAHSCGVSNPHPDHSLYHPRDRFRWRSHRSVYREPRLGLNERRPQRTTSHIDTSRAVFGGTGQGNYS